MARHTRARRGDLSAEKIIGAALKICDSEGLSRLTVRRLAAELGTSPMAVYGHFRNKEQILAQLVEVVIHEFAITDHGDIRDAKWVVTCFLRMREALVAHPGVIPLLGTSASVGPKAMHVMVQLMQAMADLESCSKQAAAKFYAMVSYTVGNAHIENGIKTALHTNPAQTTLNRLPSVLKDLDASTLKMVPAIVNQASKEAFTQGLNALLLGIKIGPTLDPISI